MVFVINANVRVNANKGESMKKLMMLVAMMVLTVNFAHAQFFKKSPFSKSNTNTSSNSSTTSAPSVTATSSAQVFNNKICPLSGRELNLNDPNDFIQMQAQGFAFNVCPKAKVMYNKNPGNYDAKITQAIADFKSQGVELGEIKKVVEEKAPEVAAIVEEVKAVSEEVKVENKAPENIQEVVKEAESVKEAVVEAAPAEVVSPSSEEQKPTESQDSAAPQEVKE